MFVDFPLFSIVAFRLFGFISMLWSTHFSLIYILYFVNGNTTDAYLTSTEATAAADGAGTNTANYIGTEVPNWLRDENEKILLYGALVEIFAYVGDDEQVAKYKIMFDNEIQELNDEDAKRNSSGGNVQVNFNGRGLI